MPNLHEVTQKSMIEAQKCTVQLKSDSCIQENNRVGIVQTAYDPTDTHTDTLTGRASR